jgi:FkbM family methyltransferase
MLYFDIGANIGKWALHNLNDNKIISIEPVPTTFKRLKDNCTMPNIVCLNYAVCDNDGKDITFYDALGAHTLSTLNLEWLTDSKSRFCNTSYQQITCPTITIDTLIKTYGMPDLIKIDVEGGEYECIKSLTSKANLLCFEWASELNHVSFKCLDYLFSLGYSNFYLQFEDNYTFRPNENDYYDLETIKKLLLRTTPKKDWGMIWCK